jgi:hypothetical protein
MLIEVAGIEPPPYGKKVGHVRTVKGLRFEAWPDKLAVLQVGQRYHVETAEREYNGRTIRKITKVESANGHTNGRTVNSPANGIHVSGAATSSARYSDTEWQFVRELLTALARAGTVKPTTADMSNAIAMLRDAYRANAPR